MPDAALDARWILGINSLLDPALLRQGEYVWSVNTDNSGGIIQTRQGANAVGVKVNPLPNYEPKGLEVFVGRDGVTKMIIAIGAELWSMSFPFTGDFVKIGEGFAANDRPVIFTKTIQSVILNGDGTLTVIDPVPYLVMTNGLERAKIWDGHKLETSTPTGAHPGIPIGKWTAWSGNRLWISNGKRLYASDLGNPLKFFESTYVAGGGALYADDDITGLSQTADLQNLIVCTDYDTTAIQSNIYDRTAWSATAGFQKVIFPGVGCAAGKSFVRQWGIVWWMSHGGWVGIDQAVMTYQRSRIQYRDQQMMRAKERLNSDKSTIVAEKFGNQLLVSVPYGSKYNSATWVLNQRVLDISSPSPSYDVADPSAWASQWTGIFPVDYALCVVGGQERLFCLSRNIKPADPEVEGSVALPQPIVWELFTGERQDRYNDQVFHPPCHMETRLLGYSEDLKTFHYADIDVSELSGLIDAEAYVAGRNGNYKQVMQKRIIASPGSVNANITSVALAIVTTDVAAGETFVPVNTTFGFLPVVEGGGFPMINIAGRTANYSAISPTGFTIDHPLWASIAAGTQITQPQFYYPGTILTSFVPQRRMLRTEEFDVSKYLCQSCGVESPLAENVDRGFALIIRWVGKMAINGIRMMTQKYPDQHYGKCEEDEEFSRSIDQSGCGAISELIQEADVIDSSQIRSQYLRSVTHRPFFEDRYNPPFEFPEFRVPDVVPPLPVPPPTPGPPPDPPLPPGPPQNLMASSGDGEVLLTWEPPEE